MVDIPSNSILPSTDPFSLNFLVTRLVSIPYNAGIPCSVNHWPNDFTAFQCEKISE